MGALKASDLVKSIKKDLKIEVETLELETLDLSKDVIDTGSATINAIVSGSAYGGIPMGRITGFYGPSGCGKTFVMGQTVGNAQKQGFIPIIVDTEGAWDARAQSFGIDISSAIIIHEEVIENVRNTLVAIIDKYEDAIEAGELKLMIVIDSLGGLKSQKEVDDANAGKTASDMGSRAKAMFGIFRGLTNKLRKSNIPLLWANHCMDDPAALRPSAIQKMPGGKSIWYFTSVIVMMRRREDKNEEDDKIDFFRNKGASIPVECVKQRYVRPFLKCETYIDYDYGLKRYAGLFEIGKGLGVITGSRTYELPDGTKLGYRKNLINDDKLWENTILPVLDPVIQRTFAFGSLQAKQLIEETDIDEEE